MFIRRKLSEVHLAVQTVEHTPSGESQEIITTNEGSVRNNGDCQLPLLI